MAFDIGSKRTGIAICDSAEKVASALKVVPTADLLADARIIKRLVEDWEPEVLIFGLPRTLSGEEGPQASNIRKVANQIISISGLPGKFVDERLSSKEAKVYMHECGMSERDMRGKIDMVAAQIFLQSYLESKSI